MNGLSGDIPLRNLRVCVTSKVCWRLRELSARIDLEKSNVYTFGMCLFFCMTLVDPGHFYTTSQALDISQLTRTLTTYRQKHVYSPLLWELLEDCLQL